MKNARLIPLLCLYSGVGICQLPQLHPELCGTPGSVVAPALGMSAVIDRDNVTVRFFFKDTAETLSVQGLLDEIAEVCPISNGQAVVFGAVGRGLRGASAIYIIDEKIPMVIDNFEGYQPIMSPDQRWIAYRKSIPPTTRSPFRRNISCTISPEILPRTAPRE
jgi:hypothetical protein